MPLYEFYCPDCQLVFEEICGENTDPPCPKCAKKGAQRRISAPSPQKKGAFPFKPGPVHPMASRMGSCQAGAACPGGGCGKN